MQTFIRGIDHVVILVRDLDAAQEAFTRLGFAPTPRGFHSIGTRNHCLMFGTDYVELLTVAQPHPVTAYFSDHLGRGEGAAAIGFATDDAHAAHAAYTRMGIAADAPADFSRPVDLPGGRVDAKFRVVQLPPAETPGCRSFLCQHFTPHAVWRPEYQDHPLGVTGIARVTVASPDPAATAAQYGRVVGARPKGSELPVGSAVFVFEKGDVAGITGVTLRVKDAAGLKPVVAHGVELSFTA
ncbi:MAG TPA: VOC family protein [Ramlibacter sp.]|nr:VOC family protein [Ramlibacter sp.]